MKRTILECFLIGLAASVFAQKSIDELTPNHAAALQKYLSAHKTLGFLQEHVIDREILAGMRKYIRRGMKPYYLVGDFNRDGFKDFALILSREGKPKVSSEEGADARKEDVNLQLVIFNAKPKGGFAVAYEQEMEAPLSCFLDMSQGRKPKLYFAVFESDADTFVLAPAGGGYIVEFDEAP